MGYAMADTNRILLTRPREDSERLAAQLQQDGIPCLIDPLLDIAPTPDATQQLEDSIRETQPQALIATSRHALPALATVHPSCRSLPLFVVGIHTAMAAKQQGFTALQAVADNVDTLLTQLRLTLEPGPLLYASAQHISRDIVTALKEDGFSVERVVTYEACAATALAPETVQALQDGHIAAIPFFSLRTLEVFTQLADPAWLSSITACCLSERIAEQARRMPWRQVAVAASTDETALLELVRHSLPIPQE